MQKKIIEKGEVINSLGRKYIVEDATHRFLVLSREGSEELLLDINEVVNSTNNLGEFVDIMKKYYDACKRKSTVYLFVDLHTCGVSYSVNCSVNGEMIQVFKPKTLINPKLILSLIPLEKENDEITGLQATIMIDYDLIPFDEDEIIKEIGEPIVKKKRNARK